jgi:hypothetical protein
MGGGSMTASTLTVTDFVLARIAEDEARALAAAEVPGGSEMLAVLPTDLFDGLRVAFPARVLAQCAAMRKVLMAANILGLDVEAAFALILAPIWADHPDFSSGWPV